MNRVFAVMPFGEKESIKNKNIKINFDSIYEKAIKPACEELALPVIRADEETSGGIIHVLMYERLVCANIAIVDITNDNPNVYYELGFRHCARPYHTIIIYDKNYSLPFDIGMERAIGYELDELGVLTEKSVKDLKCKLQTRLKLAIDKNNDIDSPAFSLIEDFPKTKIEEKFLSKYKAKQDCYDRIKMLLSRAQTVEDINKCIDEINKCTLSINSLSYGIIQAYQRIKAFTNLVSFIEGNKQEFENNLYINQQYALALNKLNKQESLNQSIEILRNIIDKFGKSSETYGLLGSAYKSLMKIVSDDKKDLYLDLAIEHYRLGFNYDIRDYYPGINLANLLLLKNTSDSLEEMKTVLNVLEYNLQLKSIDKSEDYWELATAYEMNILLQKYDKAEEFLKKIERYDLIKPIPPIYKSSTLKNLEIIKNIYAKKNYKIDWFDNFQATLKV